MTFLVPTMAFGWILVAIVAYRKMDPADASILVVVGGVLFLPMYSFEIPRLPEYDKIAAISMSLLVGQLLGGARAPGPGARSKLDIPMIIWCSLAPVATSLSNGLGLYDGVSNMVRNILAWGVFYWTGRRFFGDAVSLRKLVKAIVVGGLLYLPLIAFEARMSPQLSLMIYGFFPHSFFQHIRYGGFRPIVFMQHGLMVALWSGVSTICAFALWRSDAMRAIKGIPMALITLGLAGGTILCKSAGAVILMAAGFIVIWSCNRNGSTTLMKVALALPIAYIAFRISDVLPISTIAETLSRYFDAERVESALMRLTEEDLFGARAMQQPVFGWGGYRRGWPVDTVTGLPLVAMVDSLWIILFSTYGFTGLVSAFLSLGAGPWKVIRSHIGKRADGRPGCEEEPVDGIILSLVVTVYMLDCLLNAMHNPVYILCSGALVSHALLPRPVLALASETTVPVPVPGASLAGQAATGSRPCPSTGGQEE